MLQSVKRRLSNPIPDDTKKTLTASSSNNSSSTASNEPKSDITLPRRDRRRSSATKLNIIHNLKDLPNLKDTPMQKREALFQQKLELCSVIFNFEDTNSDKKGKDLKRQTLLELVDYVNNSGGQKIFTEALMPDIVNMVSINICRALPPPTVDFDPEEDEPFLESSWPHL